jgi:hypothetical protein
MERSSMTKIRLGLRYDSWDIAYIYGHTIQTNGFRDVFLVCEPGHPRSDQGMGKEIQRFKTERMAIAFAKAKRIDDLETELQELKKET